MRPILALLVAALAGWVGLADPAEARPRRPASTSGLVVDVSALRARGLVVEADIIQSTIAQEIARNGPRTGRIHIRITSMSLSGMGGGPSGGLRGRGLSGGAGSDYLEGDFQILGPRGEVLAGRPMVVNAPSSSGGAWYLPDFDQRRIAAVARSFAGWVRQYGG